VRTGDWVIIASIAGLIVVAGFFAMAETALTRINRVKAITMAEEGRRGAGLLVKLADHTERFLNPVLFLVLICHLAAGTLLGLVTERYNAAGLIIGLVVEAVIIFVLAEAAPKTWAIQHTERAALLAAPLVTAIATFPPVRLLARGLIGLSNTILPGKGLAQGPFVSEEELLATVDVALEDEIIEREERALIHSIIEFGDTVAREVMVPRPDMVAVEGGGKVGDVMEVAMAAGYSRIPVYEQGIDDVIGVVYTKDLMRAEREGQTEEAVRNLVRAAHFVPETKRVNELMREMQHDKFHMAIVVDEYGGTAGLVTLEDLIEELVGEIVDEFDVEEAQIERLPGGNYRVNARMPIDEVNDLLHADLPTGDWDTVGGLLFSLLGHVPAEGESADVDSHRLAAEKVQGRRIGRVRIERLPDAPAPDQMAM
jgi:CBS domain containing-hemolysin-like protein